LLIDAERGMRRETADQRHYGKPFTETWTINDVLDVSSPCCFSQRNQGVRYATMGTWMDLVALLEESVAELPSGEYSVGLNAIVRHVKAAIRHLERDRIVDPDTCTDAIYRMNQAYEGSLKEAYRVLAGKDPSGLSPFQIENYLESNNVVRPRVLTQLIRYRQDYRNPSTHDYKLDFDADEALLAITSVCGFAKLLFNQIKSKLASNAAVARVAASRATTTGSPVSVGAKIATTCLAYTNESVDVAWFEFERGITDALVGAGLAAELHLSKDGNDDESIWDVLVRVDEKEFGISARVARPSRPAGDLVTLDIYKEAIPNLANVCGVLVIIRSIGGTGYKLFSVDVEGKPLFIICDDDPQQFEHTTSVFGALEEMS
jgi:hypothetical protein